MPPPDRELTDIERQILLADVTSLYAAMPSAWDQALSVVQATVAVVLSTLITIVVARALVPADLPWAILGLYVTASGVYLFLAIRVGWLIWIDGWREELAARLGAWQEPLPSWRRPPSPPGPIAASLAKFYAWTYSDEWPLYAHQFLQFLTIGLVFFGAVIGYLSAEYWLVSGVLAVPAILLGLAGAIGWTLVMRTVTTLQLHTFSPDVKRRAEQTVNPPQAGA